MNPTGESAKRAKCMRRSRRRRLFGWAGLAILVAMASGCASGGRFAGLGAEGEFLAGKDLYDRGRCFQAAEALQAFLVQHPGSIFVDEAIFYLGLSRKCLGEYILAREEFDRLLREFPQSEHREEAEWERAMCFHLSRHSADRDPEPTEQAIRAFRAYLDHYPEGAHRAEALEMIVDSNDRLARKAYENGRTYVMLRQWDAAALYFAKSLDIVEESSVAPKAYDGLVRAHAEDAREALDLGQRTEALASLAACRDAVARLEAFATPEREARYGKELAAALREARSRLSDISAAVGAAGDGVEQQASGDSP